jgi:hypothetical protein
MAKPRKITVAEEGEGKQQAIMCVFVLPAL